MTKLIIDGKASADKWIHLADDEALSNHNFTISIDRWHTQLDDIIAHIEHTGHLLGVRLATHSDPLLLGSDIHRFSLIVIEIANAADGRFFSIAARIREHLHYTRELRVTGEVAPDQLSFMQRCGINSFTAHDDIDIARFNTRYQRYYQSSTHPTPEERLIRQARRRNVDVTRRDRPSSAKRRYFLVDGVIEPETV